ncbi:hypothetical protein [Arthrobacter sp. CAL618]|uniref:hypothetical protein n=1 Tax=Arthrobacter sp. CAL618 TaxID=1055770 RepID=UPI0004651C33|nr:hypothetical protein [Arthrobacter sp. CAL618]
MEQQPQKTPALATRFGLVIINFWLILGVVQVGLTIWGAAEGEDWGFNLALGLVWIGLALGWVVARRRAIRKHEES